MGPRVLFVCLGNICRSPAAEAVVRAQAEARGLAIRLDSAGTSGWHEGEAPYPPMIAAAARRGYDMTQLRARRFRPEDFANFDLIVVMDHANRQAVDDLRPPNSPTPVRLFMDYAPRVAADEVPDPYYTRDFDGALDLIETAADGLLRAQAAQP